MTLCRRGTSRSREWSARDGSRYVGGRPDGCRVCLHPGQRHVRVEGVRPSSIRGKAYRRWSAQASAPAAPAARAGRKLRCATGSTARMPRLRVAGAGGLSGAVLPGWSATLTMLRAGMAGSISSGVREKTNAGFMSVGRAMADHRAYWRFRRLDETPDGRCSTLLWFVAEEDHEPLRLSEGIGWVDLLAVRHGGSGAGSAWLLRQAMVTFRDRGRVRGAGVDARYRRDVTLRARRPCSAATRHLRQGAEEVDGCRSE